MNRENLETLVRYLLTRPRDDDQFHMHHHAVVVNPRTGSDVSLLPQAVYPYPSCGTVCCAVGFGPAAGLSPIDGEGWPGYQDRMFGLNRWETGWCFASSWSLVDNTPHGAAARILWLLEYGVPDDSEAQRLGRRPLCYNVPEPTQAGGSA